MAASVATYSGDLLAPSSRRRDLRPPTTGSDKRAHGLDQRIKALVAYWDTLQQQHGTPRHLREKLVAREISPRDLFKPVHVTPRHVEPPPSYEDSVSHLPPDYTSTEALATVYTFVNLDISKNDVTNLGAQTSSDVDLDLTSPEGIRTHVNKKSKAAAKMAQMSKYAGGDEEEKKDEAADDGAGDDGGAGAGGDAGGGGDDAPGEPPEEDDGATGGGKKSKKKKKKNAWEDFEDDEKKKEEEEAKKAEEEGAAAAGAAAEAVPTNEWGSFAPVSKKGKKGKKGMAEPEPAPEPEPVIISAAPAEAIEDDAWGSTVKKKKGTKKGKTDPAPAAAHDTDMKFDNVNLNDDKAAPKLDLDFGLDDVTTDTKSGNGFSFGGGWGGGWGAGGASGGATGGASGGAEAGAGTTWGFGGADDGKKNEAADNTWGTASTKKDKKKKATGAFDFSFDDGDKGADLGLPPKEEEKPAEEDAWGGFTSTGKKDKTKKKKGAAADPEPVVVAPPPPPPPVEEKVDADPWAELGSAKDKKKIKKKSIWDDEPESIAEEPVLEEKKEEKPEEDLWGSLGVSAKDKKKAAKKVGKGAAVEEKPVEKTKPDVAVTDDLDSWDTSKKDKKKKSTFDWGALDDPTPEPPPPVAAAKSVEPETDWLGDGWDTGKKVKKGKKGALVEDVSPPVPKAEPQPAVDEEKKKTDEDFFGGWGDNAKDKKKKKAGKSEPEPVSPPEPEKPAIVEKAEVEDTLGSLSAAKKVKKSKRGAVVEEIPPPPPKPDPKVEPVETKADDDFMTGWGLKKDKKKKDALPEPVAEPVIILPAIVDETKANGDDEWTNTWTTGTKKKTTTKKDKSKGITEIVDASPGASVVLPDSVQEKSAEEDIWGTLGNVGKKEKKKGTKNTVAETPKNKLIEAAPEALLDLDEAPVSDPWNFATSPDKKAKKDKKAVGKAIVDDEAPIPEPSPELEDKEEKKSSKSSWGSTLWGSSSKTTPKTAKEKEKEKKEQEAKDRAEKRAAEDAAEAERKAEEVAFAEALGDDDILDFADDVPAPPPTKKVSSKDKDKDKDKDSKKKVSEKSTKVDPKPSKKSALKDEPAAEQPAVLDLEPTADELADLLDEPKKSDGWGFWGSSLKSTKKATTAKEIGSEDPTNQETTVEQKMPEDKLATSPPKSTSKTKADVKSSSIADRIKALQPTEAEVEKPYKKLSRKDVPPPVTEPEPEVKPVTVTPPSPEAKKSKDKKSSTSKSSKKDKSVDRDIIAPASPIPGGFPDDANFDFFPSEEMPAVVKTSSSKDKDKKVSSKSTKRDVKPSKIEDPIVVSATADDLVDARDPELLPSPPPERRSKRDSQSAKKERPKVVRDQQSTSWGFWNATAPPPKSGAKESRFKDVASPSKERPPGLSRSRSERKPSEKDPLEKASKSSGSDKDAKSDPRSRPSTSRGTSFGAMFGKGPPPSRSKSNKIPSSSRRHSTAVGDSGLMSPPPEYSNAMSGKAADLMGISRSKSTREKTKSRKVPDPYPIDDDDEIVMVDPPDSAKDMPPYESAKEKRPRRSKRESGMMSGGLAEDDITADASRGSDEANDFIRPSLKRSSTTASKKAGLIGGLFGAAFGSSRAAPDRRQNKAYESEDGLARNKRGSVYEDDAAKRLRRDDRRVHRSRKPSAADGFTDAAPAAEVEDPDREARRAERRARKEQEAAEENAKAVRRREEEERLTRGEDERRRVRRAERDSRQAEDDRIAREEEAKTAERRERRREKERRRVEEEAAAARSKPSDRRRSYVDRPSEDEEARRVRREDRRVRHSVDQSAGMDKDRPRTSRRRSEYPAPVDDVSAEKRSGEHPSSGASRAAPYADGVRPSTKPPGGDKTASWVHSINFDPPLPPPLEGTIIDAPVHYADDLAPDPLNETTARELRHRQRRERERSDGYSTEEPRSRRRREAEAARSSDDTAPHDRNRNMYAGGPVNSLGYNEMGVKTWDGRPAMPPKKESWFKKIAGL